MKKAPTGRKLRGGYYTPAPIARFLAEWAVRRPSDRVLEPSCGDGALLAAAARRLGPEGALRAFEIDGDEAVKARATGARVEHADFNAACEAMLARGETFDAVVGNPPYVRYQHFPETQREPAFRVLRSVGLRPTRLLNAWVPFVVGATLLLAPGGRLAMVVPAELFQVDYAAETRRFLAERFRRVTILTFRGLVFDGIQQEVVLLLGERDDAGPEGIRVVELDDLAALDGHELRAFEPLHALDHDREKWTKYFLSARELDLLRAVRRHPGVTWSGDVMEVDVGVVTGQNDFFVLRRGDVERRGLEAHVIPLAGRSTQLAGLTFGRDDWERLSRDGHPMHLLALPRADAPSDAVRAYVAEGEARGFHAGFKCRHRAPWYSVPSVRVPDAFFLRQIDGSPRIVLDAAGATCTDTLHRVRFRPGVDPAAVTLAVQSSLTFAFAEVTGRSYGGGVLTFEPSEAERLPLPLANAGALDLAWADARLRAGRLQDVLDAHDRALLVDGLGLSADEAAALRGIWEKLRDRRRGRRRRARGRG